MTEIKGTKRKRKYQNGQTAISGERSFMLNSFCFRLWKEMKGKDWGEEKHVIWLSWAGARRLGTREESFITQKKSSPLWKVLFLDGKRVEKVKWKESPWKWNLNRFGSDVYKYEKDFDAINSGKEKVFIFPLHESFASRFSRADSSPKKNISSLSDYILVVRRIKQRKHATTNTAIIIIIWPWNIRNTSFSHIWILLLIFPLFSSLFCAKCCCWLIRWAMNEREQQ